MKKIVTIEGMSCGHCVMHVRSALEAIPGAKSVEVDLLKKNAVVEGDNLNDVSLNAAIIDAGYTISAIVEST